MARTVLLEVRDPGLVRRGQILPDDLLGFTLVRRRRALGAWSVQVDGGSPMGALLRQPGWGLVATLDTGDVFLSGPTQHAEITKSTSGSSLTVSGYDDNRVLGDLLAWPTPSSSDATVQPGTANSGFDQRSGKAETVMRAYVLANAGQLAPTDRRVALLDVAADQARGGTVTGSARFDVLNDLLDGIAKVGDTSRTFLDGVTKVTAGLGYRVRQNGNRLLFEVTVPRDVSGLVRFDVDNGTAESLTYSYESPTVTRVIVGGPGTNAARTLVPRWTSDSLAAETLWGRRIEQFADDQSSTTTSELQQTGDQILADGGATKVAVDITPVDTDLVMFGRDYMLGDLVTVVVDDIEVKDVVSEVTISQDDTGGLSVKATVGDVSTVLTNPLLKALAITRDQARRLGRLERR